MAAGGQAVMVVGARSNTKGRDRSAKIALALALSLDDNPDKSIWCPGFTELAKRARNLLRKRPRANLKALPTAEVCACEHAAYF